MISREEAQLRRLDRVAAVLAILALGSLVLRFGLPAVRIPRSATLLWSAALPTGLFLESLLRLLVVRDPVRYLKRHPLRYAVLLMILLELSGVATWTATRQFRPASASVIASEIYLAVVLLGFAGSWAKGLVTANRWLANRHVPLLALPPLTYGLAIVAGAALLALPGLHRQPAGLVDHLFTATSALCVTGLAVYDVGQTLTPVGQVVLALLIQLGGLGTMTILGMLVLWQHRRLSLGERVALRELVGGTQLLQTRRLIGTVARVTMTVELVGTALLWLHWRGHLGSPLPKALFHSISAFCNAGFCLFSDSLAGYRGDVVTQVVIMGLIVAGGAGFTVVADLMRTTSSKLVPWIEPLHLRRASRVVLYWSAALIAAGTVAFLLDAQLTGQPRTFIQALFQSVTTRTAGFQVESQLGFGAVGLWATLILMIIGASAQSTGGGVKTVVVARLFSRIDRQDDPAAPKPLLRFKPFRIALLLASVYLVTGAAGTFVLWWREGLSLRNAAFEALSALGTVGLSRDVTPGLSGAGKLFVVILMFAGRVLYPTFVIRVVRARRPDPDLVEWA
jgi:trk system potassium uptake protein